MTGPAKIKILCLLLFYGRGCMLMAQDTLYMDTRGQITTPQLAATYSIVEPLNQIWLKRDFDAQTHRLVHTAHFLSSQLRIRTAAETWWHNNGHKEREQHFHQGKADGAFYQWYPNGEIRTRGQFEQGQPVGGWYYGYSNGQAMEEGAYLNGKYHVRHFWQLDGVQTIRDGSGTYITLHEGGQIHQQGQYRGGQAMGLWQSWYPNGQKLEEIYFNEGQAEGLHQYWFPSGQLEGMGVRTGGNKAGPWQWWDERGKLIHTDQHDPKSPREEGFVFGERAPIPINLTEINKEIGYPASLRRQRISGEVRVWIQIDSRGHYEAHSVYVSDHEDLTQRVEPYLSRLRFIPALRRSVRVGYYLEVPFRFEVLD